MILINLEIKNYINTNGFEKAVAKYSIGESAIIGGEIGWQQSQLSQEFIKNQCNKYWTIY